MGSSNDFGYLAYLEDYYDSLHGFVYDMNEKDTNSTFFKSFYSVCVSMINNGTDLSQKQIDIIEREMVKHGYKIPQLKDYNLKITLMVNISFNDIQFRGRVDLDSFIKLLDKRKDFSDYYEKLFDQGENLILHI